MLSQLSSDPLRSPRAPFVDTRSTPPLSLLSPSTLSPLFSEALAKFDQSAFKAAGYPDWVRKRIVQVGYVLISAGSSTLRRRHGRLLSPDHTY